MSSSGTPGPGAQTVSRSGTPRADPALAGRGGTQGHRRRTDGCRYGIGGLPGGRRGKYAVLAVWAAIVAVGGYAATVAHRGAAGTGVSFGGPRDAGAAGSAAGLARAFTGIDTTLLVVGLAVIVVLLPIAYRRWLLWAPPIVSVTAALTGAEAVIYLLARYAGLTVSAQGSGILTVLVLGAGTGYALPVIARYREELRRHRDRHRAMAVALRRAGPAIIASAVTVAGGMVYLLVAGSASIAGLAAVAATGILAGLLAMITLLPALLVLPARWPAGGTENIAATGTAPAASTSLSMGGVTLAEQAMASGRGGPAALHRRPDAAATSENSGNIKVPVG